MRILILSCLAVLLLGCSKKEIMHGVHPETRSISETVVTVGQIKPRAVAEIRSELPGRIVSLRCKSGDRVSKGDVLLTLDPVTYEQNRTSASLRLKNSRLLLKKLSTDLTRHKQLHDKSVTSEQDLEDMQCQVDQAEIAVTMCSSDLAKAEDDLRKTTITAPLSGTVMDNDLETGQVITGADSYSNGTLLMRLADMGDLEMVAEVSELDIGKLSVGMAGRATLEARPDTPIDGVIYYISPNLSTGRDGSQVYTVRMRIQTVNGLRIGLSARITFVTAQRSGVSLPTALIQAADSPFVYALRNGKTQKVPITLGIRDSTNILVDGVSTSDEILPYDRAQ